MMAGNLHSKSTSKPTNTSWNEYDLAGITTPDMTYDERFRAVARYWAERNKRTKTRTAVEYKTPALTSGCNCDGSGWYMLETAPRKFELTKCTCGAAGASRNERQLSRELDMLAGKTFDNFNVQRAYRDLPDASAKLQAQMVQIAYNKARQYAEAPRGWLYIHGRPGVGKSHLAAAIANRNRHMSVIYRSMPAFLDIIREQSNALETLMTQIATADLVIIDDIGADNRPSEWAEARIFSVINNRVDKPTVYTSNYDVQELPYGEHIRDRLNASRRCWINASSARQET
jgi:DNA replication protein DnaC